MYKMDAMQTPQPKVSFKEQMHQAREDAILQSACRLLGEKDFDAMTMDDVANAVGIAKASLYKHFCSKEELCSAAMVRASSINPAFTITVGLCVSGALCALSGGLLAQYQKSCDINVGTGMVTIALASLIIGETLVGKRTMLRRVLGVVFGSCLYRFIVAVALRFNVPAAAMKLVSAIIVAVAISMPAIREHFAFEKRKHAARARRAAAVKEGK